ncbi:MAG: ribosome maturation factor RimM [Actinomycetota bacterium]|nr:ribosome maturation factor RimM [Actinomycetota bacterium]
MPAPNWLAAGRVGRPHGLDGSFHVTGARPGLLAMGGAVRLGEDETEIERLAGTGDRPIVRVRLAGTREAIEMLRGQDVLVPRAVAPALEADEWYATDLEGLRVVDGATDVGWVSRLLPLPSCEALEVARADGRELLVPLVRDAVRSVDLDAGTVDVDLAFLGEEA